MIKTNKTEAEIRLMANKGTDYGNCLLEAIGVCVECRLPVTLVFNDSEYRITPKLILEGVSPEIKPLPK